MIGAEMDVIIPNIVHKNKLYVISIILFMTIFFNHCV